MIEQGGGAHQALKGLVGLLQLGVDHVDHLFEAPRSHSRSGSAEATELRQHKPDPVAALAAYGVQGSPWKAFQEGLMVGSDGKVNEDKLGLDQIYMQAKQTLKRELGLKRTSQAFIGAMTSGGCRKGVFVTTSQFTADAIRIAEGIRDPRLVLVGGERLVELMNEHGVEVQTREVIRISRLDVDFFSGGD